MLKFFKNIFDSFYNNEIVLETKRLILRPWKESDAEALYFYAKDQRVGPSCGWLPHKNIEESKNFIKNNFGFETCFAIVPKEVGHPVGCISLVNGNNSNLNLPTNEGEIGYWIGVPFWNKGYMTEAVKKVMEFGFNEMGLKRLWCGYFDGNNSSKRVQEKCGFKYKRLRKNYYWRLLNKYVDEHITSISKREWKDLRKNEVSN